MEETIERKIEVFQNPSVQDRLQQGVSNPLIASLLECKTLLEIRNYLVSTSLKDPGIVGVVNRYLKRIAVKTVKIADFKPSSTTVQKDQIRAIAQEFQAYLEEQLSSIDDDDDTLPILQIE